MHNRWRHGSLYSHLQVHVYRTGLWKSKFIPEVSNSKTTNLWRQTCDVIEVCARILSSELVMYSNWSTELRYITPLKYRPIKSFPPILYKKQISGNWIKFWVHVLKRLQGCYCAFIWAYFVVVVVVVKNHYKNLSFVRKSINHVQLNCSPSKIFIY